MEDTNDIFNPPNVIFSKTSRLYSWSLATNVGLCSFTGSTFTVNEMYACFTGEPESETVSSRLNND